MMQLPMYRTLIVEWLQCSENRASWKLMDPEEDSAGYWGLRFQLCGDGC